MVQHVHAAALAKLKDENGDPARSHPGHEPLNVREPFFRGDVIVGRKEDEIRLRRGLSGHDGLSDRLDRRERLRELTQQIGVGFDRDGLRERAREGLGQLPVPRAGIDEHPAGRKPFHHALQPAPRVAFLIGMVEEQLKGLFVRPASAIEDTNPFLVSHNSVSPVAHRESAPSARRSIP